jgi:hypothetical protein
VSADRAGRPESVDLGLGRVQAGGGEIAQVGHRRVDVGKGQFGGDEARLEAGQGKPVRKPGLRVVPSLARRPLRVAATAGGEDDQLAAAEDEVLGALSDRRREQLFELLQRASAGRTPDCAAAAAEPEGDC